MTLIEVMFEYQRLLRKYGRNGAETLLRKLVDESLIVHITSSFNNRGEFIDALGRRI